MAEQIKTPERLAVAQPVVTYEDGTYVCANYRVELAYNEPNTRHVVGFSSIDQHVESLLEEWKGDDRNIVAGIDACTIIEQLSSHYPKLPDKAYDTLLDDVVRSVQQDGDLQKIILRAMQIPKLDAALLVLVMNKIHQSENLDRATQDTLVRAYLETYASLNLPRGGNVDALYELFSVGL